MSWPGAHPGRICVQAHQRSLARAALTTLVLAVASSGCGEVRLAGPPGADAAQPPVDSAPIELPDAPGPPGPDARPSPPDAADVVPCFDGDAQLVDPETGTCYMLFWASPLTWPNARDRCEDLGPTTHLATITTEHEHALLVELAGPYDAFLAGNDRTTEGQWRWLTGEPMDFQAWGPGEPNDGNDMTTEDCMIMRKLDGDPGTWDDRVCGNALPYLCERE